MRPPILPTVLAAAALAAGCTAPIPPSGAAAARSRGAGEAQGGETPPPAEGAAPAAPPRPTDPWLDDLTILARVNGEVIPLRRIRHAMGPSYEQFLPFREELAAKVSAELRTIVLRFLAVEEGLRLGLKPTDEEMEQAEARTRDQAQKAGTTMEQYWKDLGMTRREWTDSLREKLIEERAFFFFTGQFPPSNYHEDFYRPAVDSYVTPEEVRAWGEEHRGDLNRPASAILRILDLRSATFREEGASEEEAWRRCLVAAEAALARARAGEPFADLARELSQGPEAKEGGLLGRVLPDGPERREFRAWAFDPARRAGEVSEPLRTPAGYVLLLLEAREEAKDRPIEEWGPEALDRIERLKTSLAWKEVCRRLVMAASFEPESLRRSILEELSAEARSMRAALPKTVDPALRTSKAGER